MYINVPSVSNLHRYPTDNYRFYADAGKSLELWAHVNNFTDFNLVRAMTMKNRPDSNGVVSTELIHCDTILIYTNTNKSDENMGKILTLFQYYFLFWQIYSLSYLNAMFNFRFDKVNNNEWGPFSAEESALLDGNLSDSSKEINYILQIYAKFDTIKFACEVACFTQSLHARYRAGSDNPCNLIRSLSPDNHVRLHGRYID